MLTSILTYSPFEAMEIVPVKFNLFFGYDLFDGLNDIIVLRLLVESISQHAFQHRVHFPYKHLKSPSKLTGQHFEQPFCVLDFQALFKDIFEFHAFVNKLFLDVAPGQVAVVQEVSHHIED